MFPLHQLAGGGSGAWTLVLSADEDNVNLKTKLEALYGSMATAVNAVVTVNSGVKIGSTTISTAAMRTGTSWPSGSTLKLYNYGMIRGKGGAGGGDSGGGTGGDALEINLNITIDNTTTGNIFSGGGGGGSGETVAGSGVCGGGGGGGAQGDNGGDAGVGAGGDFPGSNGTAGGESTLGEGGGGGTDGTSAIAGAGGRGGGWGAYGNGGDTASAIPPAEIVVYGGYPGGAPGKAIDKNGKSVTWIAGNNATQVKGAVS